MNSDSSQGSRNIWFNSLLAQTFFLVMTFFISFTQALQKPEPIAPAPLPGPSPIPLPPSPIPEPTPKPIPPAPPQ